MKTKLTLTFAFFFAALTPMLAADEDDRTKKAVNAGLTWLVKQQQKDGRWTAQGEQYPTAMTAIAGVALVAEGSTPKKGKYAEQLKKATAWLLEQSNQGTGLIGGTHPSEQGRYTIPHGFAMYYLSLIVDDLPAEQKKKARDVLNRAVQFTGQCQTKRGGWGYVSAKDGADFDEGCCTVTQIHGLHAARTAGIPVPVDILKNAHDYMKKSTGQDGGILYSLAHGVGGGGRPPLTAAALAVNGVGDAKAPEVAKWHAFCKKNIPMPGMLAARFGHDEYTIYYYSKAMYGLGDGGWVKLFPDSKQEDQLTWSRFRTSLSEGLVKRQQADGSWSGQIAPVMATAMYLTALQLDKGHIPTQGR